MSVLNDVFTFSKGVTLKNRLVMAPMTTYSGEDNGQLSEDEFAYYTARCKDVGLVITGTSYTVPSGKGFSGQYYAGNDEYLPGLTKLASRLKANGAKAIMQIFHAGRMTQPALAAEQDIVSASNIPALRDNAVTPRPLEHQEITEIIQSFADVTKRAIKAGFDGVEIHGANTYLIQQFHSPHSNRRTDEWGGNSDARMRFPIAVTEAVLNAVRESGAEKFLVGYRISPEELEEPGLHIEDTLQLADALADLPLDYLHLSVRRFDQTSLRNREEVRKVGVRFKECVRGRLPLIGVGSIVTRQDADDALALAFDLVAVGSGLVADPGAAGKLLMDKTPTLEVTQASREERFIPGNMFSVMVARPVDPRLTFTN